MDSIAASAAKQSFGRLLARVQQGPVAIERHGKVVAGLVPAQWLEQAPQLDDRRQARAAQQHLEQQRLANHLRLGIELLCAPAKEQRVRVAAARAEVQRWEDGALCSADYIERWRKWLALPVASLVKVMCSDAEGWGRAMRQNSPFAVGFH